VAFSGFSAMGNMDIDQDWSWFMSENQQPSQHQLQYSNT